MAEFINTIDVLGDDAVVDSIIDRTITEFKDNQLTRIGEYAFRSCAELEAVDTPNVTTIEACVFYGCLALKSVNMPNITKVCNDAFNGCTALTSIDFPLLQNVGYNAFRGCTALSNAELPLLTSADFCAFLGSGLTEANFPLLSWIGIQAFQSCHALKTVKLPALIMLNTNTLNDCRVLESADFTSLTSVGSVFWRCYKLTKLIIRNESTVCTLCAANAFDDTPIAAGTGYIYVPAALVDSYKSATNWSVYADQIRALEDYTVDGTVTGELDETKI